MYPEELKYTPEHEWARREGGKVRVGITQFAAERLSDVVFIELPPVGAVLGAMQPFGVIESVKAVSDLYAPISGKVAEVNQALGDRPELVNQDPYGDGWMLIMTPNDPVEYDRLLSSEDYRKLIGELEQ